MMYLLPPETGPLLLLGLVVWLLCAGTKSAFSKLSAPSDHIEDITLQIMRSIDGKAWVEAAKYHTSLKKYGALVKTSSGKEKWAIADSREELEGKVLELFENLVK